MTRLLVHVEGETEETFVKELLGPHLLTQGYARVAPRLMGNARGRDRRGGIKPWPAALRDIVNHLREDRTCVATTMVDYYGMPQAGPAAWPGRATAPTLLSSRRAQTVEEALGAEVGQEMGPRFDPRRFIPYVVMHEFEALLFSDCEGLARGVGQPDLASSLQVIRDSYANPEEIDDSPHTAPSKRIEKSISAYQKPLHGNFAALEIGLSAMRTACPGFRRWLERLERVVSPAELSPDRVRS